LGRPTFAVELAVTVWARVPWWTQRTKLPVEIAR